ncbi:MAG: multiheme c-type cytochrome [Terriglobia bacterium]
MPFAKALQKFGAFVVLVIAAALPARCAHPCAQCHPREVAGYAATAMAHSLGLPKPEPPGRFVQAKSGSKFSVTSTQIRMVQRVERGESTEEYQATYAIGSGLHAVGYLIGLGDHLFQSPFCYYPKRGWGLAPGYETQSNPDFSRPVTPACLFCHSGLARPNPGTLNSYQNPPSQAEGISCERCHGPSESHLRNPVPGSIINPATLPERARDSVCEQCHLIGEARTTNPGEQFSDFQAGQTLEDVFSVYVYDGSLDPSRANPFKVISQSQELALSQCSRMSHGKLWCGTCHDPHARPADPVTYFRNRCLTCHGAALLKTHPKPNENCIGCHMPRREVTDGAHTTFTDHRITRRPIPENTVEVPVEDRKLIAWHEPPAEFADRDLGLADVEVGERLRSKSMTLAGMQLLLACWSKSPNDVAVLTGIGEVLFNLGENEHSAAVYEQAIQLEPNVAAHYLHAAVAWHAAGDNTKAVTYLDKALQLDPLYEEAYRQLGGIYSEVAEPDKVRDIHERYLKAFPGTVAGQMGR